MSKTLLWRIPAALLALAVALSIVAAGHYYVALRLVLWTGWTLARAQLNS